MSQFGSRRIYYNNFAGHLLNAYNPNMLYPGLPYQWTDENWAGLLKMVAGFGFNVFEFWLEPRLFSQEALETEYGNKFIQQMRYIVEQAHALGLQVEMIAGLATSGSDWRTLCPNLPDEWQEIQRLWRQWMERLPGIDIVGIFPGDPGACSRNGCTALTYIDKSIEIAHQIVQYSPEVEVEFNTWGPPFFGWGNLRSPENWQGEFIPEYQHTAWDFDAQRADESMNHLLNQLHDFPAKTSISINMGFNGDGNPEGEQDARSWVVKIAEQRPVYTWDFSLTEGENNIIPHYRFNRLFHKRKLERELGVYAGGICFTMSPLLNQLSLYEAAQSFLQPDTDPDELATEFYTRLFGVAGREIVPYLPLFEVIRDWGNYHEINLSRREYHQKMSELAGILRELDSSEAVIFLHPSPEQYHQELLFFSEFFAALSGPAPDYQALRKQYWQRIYRIYDELPQHVDPRPHFATDRLIEYFQKLN